MLEKIKQIFENNIDSSAKIKSLLNKHPDIKQYLENILQQTPEFEKASFVLIALIKNLELTKCKQCGKFLTYTRSFVNHSIYCSKQCKHLDIDWRNKCSESKQNIDEQAALKKREQTCLDKYGVKNISQLKEIQEKKQNTCFKNFGCEFPMQSESVKKLSKESLIEKYGVEHISQVDLIKSSKQFKRALINFKNLDKFKKVITPNFSFESYLKQGLNGQSWKCSICGNIFSQDHSYTTKHIDSLATCPRCLKCFPISTGKSKMEKELVEFLKQYFPDLKENDRTLIKPKELDIVIPSKNIAIEFNGSYWHSEQAGKDKNYHLNKTLMCEQEGYRLIHVYEHDWSKNKEIIKKKLKAILGIEQERVYARKCTIKEIPTQLKNKFLNENHIQGEDKSPIKLGLFSSNELVAVMTFCKPRFNKNYEWELSRYATSKHIIGGASKLLKYFEHKYLPKSIITYADRSYSQGNLYNQLGFKFLYLSEPNYWWINNSTIYSRYQCQKHKLSESLKIFDESLSESENMLANGFYRIFDCGNLVFEKIII